MQIAENGRKGETVLTLSNDELQLFQQVLDYYVKEGGFTVEYLTDSGAAAIAADLTEWQEYKRLRAKFAPALFEAKVETIRKTFGN